MILARVAVKKTHEGEQTMSLVFLRRWDVFSDEQASFRPAFRDRWDDRSASLAFARRARRQSCVRL
jgi:hypothetical protein